MQIEIDYTSRKENNTFSQSLLEANKDKINKQCRLVLELLQQGKRLTVYSALVEHGISSLPRRVLDIKEKLGIEIKSDVINGRFKEYYL